MIEDCLRFATYMYGWKKRFQQKNIPAVDALMSNEWRRDPERIIINGGTWEANLMAENTSVIGVISPYL